MRRVVVIIVALAVAGLVGWRTAEVIRTRRAHPAPAGSARARAVAVRAVPAARGSITTRASYAGEVPARARGDVVSRIGGIGAEIPVQEGDLVQKGQVVARLDPKELRFQVEQARASANTQRLQVEQSRVTLATQEARLAQLLAGTPPEQIRQAEEQIRQARANLEYSRQQLKRAEEINGARRQVEQAEVALRQAQSQLAQVEVTLRQAQALLAESTVRAPAAGVVSRRLGDPGATVTPSTALLQMVDVDPVVISIPVAERETVFLRPGMSAAISADPLPGRTFQGNVTTISAVLAAATRTAEGKNAVPNPERRLRPGMTARG